MIGVGVRSAGGRMKVEKLWEQAIFGDFSLKERRF